MKKKRSQQGHKGNNKDALSFLEVSTKDPIRSTIKKRFLSSSIRLLVVGSILSILLFFLIWLTIRDLPDLTTLKNYHPWQTTKIYSVDGSLVMEVADQKRTVLAYNQFPNHLVQAIVAAEDAKFFVHQGLDYIGILRAFWHNLCKLSREPLQGGSTITQQVVKTFLLTPKQTYSRKIREAILARRLEQNLTKEEILYLYLNQIDFGNQRFGVEAASQFYFRKSAKDLTLAESAILAGIPKHPPRYNPYHSKSLAKRRRNYVLKRMVDNQFITEKVYAKTVQLPIPSIKKPSLSRFAHDYYTAEVKRRALKQLSHYLQQHPQREKTIRARYLSIEERRQLPITKVAERWLQRGGLNIQTVMEPNVQKKAIIALKKGIREQDKKTGYRGPIQHVEDEDFFVAREQLKTQSPSTEIDPLQKALILKRKKDKFFVDTGREQGWLFPKQWQWIKTQHHSPLRKGDLVWVQKQKIQTRLSRSITFSLEQIPQLQGSISVIKPFTRRVIALVGGYDFKKSPFNRSTQSKRQPGSAFKPIVFATAIESGLYTASSMVNDFFYKALFQGKYWVPKNSNGIYRNQSVRLREALIHSINTVAVRVLERLGTKRVIEMAKKIGIQTPLADSLTLALGSSAVHPIELVNTFSTFAARGVYDKPFLISRIITADNKSLFERVATPTRVLSSATAYILTDMMQDVVRYGTAKQALKIPRPVAGKTGTTNESRNTWFIGFTPELCAGVWIGHDDRSSISKNASGSQSALPIFVDFMKHYYPLDAKQQNLIQSFQPPPNLLFVRIDPKNGLRSSPANKQSIFEVYVPGTEPKEYAKGQGPTVNPENFYAHFPP